MEDQDYKFKLPDAYTSLLGDVELGSQVIMGFRPEDIDIGYGDYMGVVYIIEPLGRDKIVHIDIGGAVIRAIAPYDYNIVEGNRVKFSIREDKIYLFDRKSGEAYF